MEKNLCKLNLSYDKVSHTLKIQMKIAEHKYKKPREKLKIQVQKSLNKNLQ